MALNGRKNWVLALFALILPAALAPCRAAVDQARDGVQAPAADVVFRHFL
ncbi:hypothetical protein [Methylobacterium sp. A54F]